MSIVAGVGVAGLTLLAGAAVSAAVTHSRVETAADMVALATASQLLTATDPCAVAQLTAQDNDVALAQCAVSGLAVTVEVAADLPPILRAAASGRQARARARAELQPESGVG